MTTRRAEAAPRTADEVRALLPPDKQAEFDDQLAALDSDKTILAGEFHPRLFVMTAWELDPSLVADLRLVTYSNHSVSSAWSTFLHVADKAPEVPVGPADPAKTLDGVTQVLVANANPDVVADFEDALGRAWAAAKESNTLGPLDALVETWWPQAVFWSDRDKALRTLADNADILANGLGDRKRHKAADVFAEWEALHGQKLDAKS